MTEYAIPAPGLPSVSVQGSAQRFPVRRIFCVGRNYADHAREMGHDPNAEPPFFFTKPADAVVESGAVIPYPPATQDFHYEAELVVALGAGGFDLDEGQARALIWGYAAGNDLTRRDIQAAAKAARRPWDMAKGFDQSAVIGAIRPGPLDMGGTIRLTVNDVLKQESTLEQMIWPVPALLSHLSRLVRLEAGDLIMTGTPAGVGPLVPGDHCVVTVDGLESAEVRIG